MGLGSTAKKLQSLADTAEDLYARLNDVRADVDELRTAVEETSEQVDRLERESAEQRALLEALADEQGVDVEEALADVDGAGSDGSADVDDESGSGDAGSESGGGDAGATGE